MTDRTVKVSLTAQVTGYLQGMEKARKATADAGTAAEQAARQVEQQKQAMESAGRGLMVVGAVAVAATALSVKAAIDWQSAWAGVTKTVDGTPAQLAEVEEGLRSLAKTLPIAHDEIAGVAEAAGQLGVAREDVVGFTKTMVDLGETTNLTADEAATSIAQISNVMGTMRREGAEGVERFGATLVALGNAGASTEAEILEMAKRIAGAAKLVGASESDVLALANAMASVGIEAQLGGGVMSRVMQRMYADVMEGGEGLENLAKVAGVSSQEFATAFETDPVRAVDMMVKGLGQIKDEGGNVIETMDNLGVKGTEETGVILRLAGAGDLLTDSLKLGDSAWESNTALAEEAAKRYATVESQLQIMSNRVTDAAISFGQVFLPAVSAAAAAIGGVADILGDLDPTLQGIIGVVALAGGAIALTGGVFLLALPKIAAFQASLVVLSTSTMPGVAASATAMQVATTRATTLMAAGAKMFGPMALAATGAAIGFGILDAELKKIQASSMEMVNSAKSATSALELMNAGAKGMDTTWWGEASLGASDVRGALEAAAKSSTNFFSAMNVTLGEKSIMATLKQVGVGLGELSGNDLPGAQKQFRLLSDEYGLNEDAQWRLLQNMPAYRDALMEVANEQGINVTSADEAANKTALLELAFGSAAPAAITASEAYLAAADETAALDGELNTLIETLNEANGIGQDAISQNIDYQAALADVDEQIRLIAEGTEGYALGLDVSTEAGRENLGMLNDLAGSSQSAAKAQFDLDGNTANYKATLEAGRQAVIDRAIALGATAEEARILADDIYAIPSDHAFTMIADTAAATEKIAQFVRDLNNIPGFRDVTINQVVKTTGADRGAVGAAYNADGGTIRGPGTGTSDSILSWLSNGEEVTRAAMADKYRPLLKAINADKVDEYRGLPGLATGGTAGYASPVQYVPSYGGGGGGSSPINVSPTVSLAGATLVMSVDGRQMTAVIQEQIVSSSNANAGQIRRGKQ